MVVLQPLSLEALARRGLEMLKLMVLQDRARQMLAACRGGSVGSYTESPGIEVSLSRRTFRQHFHRQLIRRHVSDYIQERDGGIAADWRSVILCAGGKLAKLQRRQESWILNCLTPGASEGIRAILKLMTNPSGRQTRRPGVMIPIPQVMVRSTC